MSNGANVRDTKTLQLLAASLNDFKDGNRAVTATLTNYFEAQKAELKQYKQKFGQEMLVAEQLKNEADNAWRAALNSKNYSDKSSEWNADTNNAAKQYEAAENVYRKAAARFEICKQIIKQAEMQLEKSAQNCRKHLFNAHTVTNVSTNALEQIIDGIDNYISIKIVYDNSTSTPQSVITTHEPAQSTPSVSNANYRLKGQRAVILNQTSDFNSEKLSDIEQELLDKGCHEITIWADTIDEKNFLIANGYQQPETHNQQIDCELSKKLLSKYDLGMSMPLSESSELNNYSVGETYFVDGIDSKKISFFDIDKFEANDSFWNHHGESKARHCELIQKYRTCVGELKNGKTLDQIRNEDSWIANAYDIFKGKDAINLSKVGDNYYMLSNGRHRITAAQLMNMSIGALVTEYHSK
jgi:hypothetical protein